MFYMILTAYTENVYMIELCEPKREKHTISSNLLFTKRLQLKYRH